MRLQLEHLLRLGADTGADTQAGVPHCLRLHFRHLLPAEGTAAGSLALGSLALTHAPSALATRPGYTPKSSARNRIPGTKCTEIAVSCI
eukprot:3512361-Rhodomonas_salina.1